MKRKRTIIIALLLLVLSVPIIYSTFFTPYKRIERFVNDLGGKLNHGCEFYLEQGYVNPSGGKPVDVMGIYGDTNKIVQFYYSGFGMGSATKYYGYYYSPNDVPVPYCNDDYVLMETSAEEWTWNGDGDNGGIIKKIRNNVYYYEAWF